MTYAEYMAKADSPFDNWFMKRYGQEYDMMGWSDLFTLLFVPFGLFFCRSAHKFKDTKRKEYYKGMGYPCLI